MPVWADSVTHSLTWALYSLIPALRSVTWASVFLDPGARKGLAEPRRVASVG
jgi:hypothetical protein